MTTYKCVNIKSKDTHLIKNTLKYYKEKALRFFEQNICQDEEPFEGYFDLIKPTIVMFEHESLDYTMFVFSNNSFYPPSELGELSQKAQAPCLYTHFNDFEDYSIELYSDGVLMTRICKEPNGINNVNSDLNIFHNVLDMDAKQQQLFKEALQEEDISKSFDQLEYVFNASLLLDYDHLDKKLLKEIESVGSKYTII